MITAHHLEVRAGARLLMDDVSFRVAAGGPDNGWLPRSTGPRSPTAWTPAFRTC